MLHPRGTLAGRNAVNDDAEHHRIEGPCTTARQAVLFAHAHAIARDVKLDDNACRIWVTEKSEMPGIRSMVE